MSWTYSTTRHRRATVDRLAAGFLARLGDVVAHCLSGAEGAVPSDFPLAGLDQVALDGVLAPLGARAVEDVYPLSPLQNGMLFHTVYDPDSQDYLVQNGFVIRGGLDVDAFERAWQHVVARHAVLRSRFAWEGLPAPVQVVVRDRPVPIERLDWTGTDPAELSARFDELMREHRETGFDLTAGCPCRLVVATVSPTEHHVLWSFHHIVLDAWSVGTVLDEVFAAYQGRAADLPAVVPYREYLRWLSTQDRAGDEAFWRTELADLAGPTTLPSATVADGGPGVGRVHRALPVELVEAAKDLAARCGCTVGTVVQAAWSLLLNRYTGETDVLFGTTVAGRAADVPGIERMVGMLINTLPTRVTLDPNQPVREFLPALHGRQLALREREHCALVDIQRCTAIPPGTALFDNILLYDNFLTDSAPGDGLEIAPNGAVFEQTDCPLVVQVSQQDAIDVVATYHRSRYDRAGCERLLGQLENLIRALVERPDAALWQLDPLSPGERELVLHTWNDTALSVPRATLGELIEAAAARTPDAPAVVDTDGAVVTYARFNAAANRLAHHLRDRGVGTESVVGVCVESSVDMLVALVGVVKSGGTYVPLDPEHPADRLAFMVADTGARVVVTQERFTDLVRSISDGELVRVDDRATLAACPDSDPTPITTADNLVYVMYTSGSTGRPKGVMISHHGLINYLWWAMEGYGIEGASGAPMLGSIAFDLSVPNFFLPLIGGKDVTLLRQDRALSGLAGLLTSAGDFSLLKLTPGHLDVLRSTLAESGAAPVVDSVRTYVVGADEVRPETVVAWREIAPGARIIDEYGPTETVVGCSTYLIDDTFDPSIPVSIGRPIGNIQMYVLDEHLNPLPIGAIGELCIGGFGVARGYWKRQGLTAEKFVPNPYGAPGDRMYRTGDLARFRPDGNLEFLGRIDHQVKIRGYRIELGEIEARLLLHPLVGEAVVDARPDPTGHKRLVGYVVPRGDLDLADLTAFVAADLPDYMIPTTWVVLAEMPLTQAGKVNRKTLPDPEHTRGAETDYVAPATTAERVLAEAWALVLGLAEVGAHDDFFVLGGDSILAIQAVGRARQAGVPVTVRQLFESRTVARLAATVEAAAPVAVQAEQGTVTGDLPLTPILRWFTATHPGVDQYNQSAVLRCAEPVDPGALAAALAALVAHHDALRLRLSEQDGSWRAVLAPVNDEPLLRVVDLVSFADRAAVRAEVGAQVQASLDLVAGPIVAAALFTGDDEPDQLLLAIHHVAVDTVSWGILLADVETAYRQLVAGESVALPAKSTSLPHWAQRLAEHAGSDAFADEAAHWLDRTEQVTALPVDHDLGANTEDSARTVEVTLPVEATRRLARQLPAERRTEVNDVLVAALARTLADWARTDAVTVELEGHGRESLFDDVDLTRTVGWFTTTRPVHCAVGTGWTDTLDQVAAAIRATPFNGIGHGLAHWLRAGSAAVPDAPVVFNYHGRHDSGPEHAALFAGLAGTLGRDRDPRIPRPHLFDVDAVIAADRLTVTWTYSANRHRPETVELLARTYLDHVADLVEHCLAAFPLSGLDSAALALLVTDDVEDVYRLSPLQAGMLIETLVAPGADPYYLQWNVELTGALDVDAFTAAWQHVVDRNPVLRTSFAWDGLPHPVQLVHRSAPVELERWDARTVPADERAAWLDRLVADERAEGIDLTGPPQRLVLVRLDEDRYRFVWNTHHIVLDRWSRELLDAEVFETYRSLVDTGSLPPLPDAVPYRDFIALIDGGAAAGERYWRTTFAGFAGPTPAPAASPTGDPTGMGVADLDLGADLDVNAAARRYGVTASTIAQAAWALLCGSATGRRDVGFDHTVAGRSADLPGIERVIGMLINTLPARVRVDPADELGTWLRRLHDEQVGRYAHEHHSLVDIHRWAGIAGTSRMSDTRFVFESSVGTDEPESHALRVADVSELNGDSEYALVLAVGAAERWTVQVRYDRARYRDDTARRVLADYATLLASLVGAEPGAPLGTVVDLSVTATAPAAVEPVRARESDQVASRSPGERVLAAIWADLLGDLGFDVHDDFFTVGGNSILVFQVVDRAQRAGLDITVRQALRHRTIAELAAAAGDLITVTTSDLLPLTPALRTGSVTGTSARLVDWPGGDPAQALRALLARHDALRLRLVDESTFRIAEPGDVPLFMSDVDDWAPVAEGIAATLDPVNGPLLGAALLRTGETARLLLVAHRIAVDEASWPILLADLAEPAEHTGSYAAWARALASHAESARFADESAYWRVEWATGAALPTRDGVAGTVRTVLPAELSRVADCARDEVVLAAVAHALTQVTGSRDVLVDLATEGRRAVSDDVDPSRTVGRFETVHPVRLHLPDGGPLRRLTAVREQVRAVPHGGVGYGLAPEPRDAHPVAEVLFRSGTGAPTAHTLTVEATVGDGELTLTWTHSAALDTATVERLAEHCAAELRAVASAGRRRRGELGRLLDGLFPTSPALLVPMARHRANGLGVAVFDGEEVTAWGEGRTGGPHDAPVTADTLFPACSVSKHVTTLGVLRLVQDGRLDLDVDIARYLRSWRVPEGAPITLRALLSHTSGLLAGSYRDYPRTEPVPPLAPMLATVVRDRPVGAGFRYSNANFAVVQQVLADVTAEPVEALLRALVLDPLGMRESGYEQDFATARADRVACGHDEDGVPLPGGWRSTPECAGSGLWSTPADIAKAQQEIVRAVAGAPTVFLSQELARAMVTPVADDYGLGTTTARSGDVLWIGHPGDRISHQSVAATDLRTGVGLVVMTNVGGGAPLFADLVTGLRLGVRYLIG